MNLFDITTGIETKDRAGRKAEKPRPANDREIKAYADWLRKRAGLSELGVMTLHWKTLGKGASAHRFCVGASWASGAHGHSVIFPGANQQRERVTMETLGDDGEVIAAQTLPIEPKKGGVIWSRADVRAAAGKIDKRNPAPVVDSTPIGETAPDTSSEAITETPAAPQEPETVPARPVMAAEPENTLSGPEIAETGQDDAAPDPISAIESRLAAIEATVVALSARSDGEAAAVATPKRSAAHERAIRRAWAERKARRDAELHIRIGIAQLDDMRQDRDAAHDELDQAQAMIADLQRIAEKHETAADDARKALGEAAEREKAALIGKEDARAQLAKLKRDMADASQPERASDIARLVQERDQARTALAAVEARAARQQAALDRSAEAIEAMGLRVAKAESLIRQLAPAA